MVREEDDVISPLTFDGINVILKLLIDEYIIPSDSIQNYLSGAKPSTKHMIKYYINYSMLIINLVKFLIFYFYPNEKQHLVHFGEFFYVFYSLEFMSLFMVVISILFILLLVLAFKIHSKKKLFIIKMMNDMKTQTKTYGLSNPRLYELEEHYDTFVKYVVKYSRPISFGVLETCVRCLLYLFLFR